MMTFDDDGDGDGDDDDAAAAGAGAGAGAGGSRWFMMMTFDDDIYAENIRQRMEIGDPTDWRDTVDGRNPKQPPGMYKTL